MKTVLAKARASLVIFLSAAIVVIGCTTSGSPSSPSSARPAEWNIVVSEKTGGGDPLSEYGTNAQYWLHNTMFEPLMRNELLPDGKSWGVVNVLADKWSYPDSKTFLVELKKGVKFHNGEELTSEHVKYAYDTLISAEKPGRRAAPLKPLGQAEIVDKYTIKWNMPQPDISVLGQMHNLLIPALTRKSMTAEQFENTPIGTGPYKVVEWPRDGIVKLEAWDGYRLGKPVPNKLVFRTVLEPSTRVLELTAGTAQIAQQIPIEAIESMQGNPTLEVVGLQGSFTLSYVINPYKTTPPLRDKRVRQAMNYAIDRESIVKSILGGRGSPLPGPLWPGYLGYTDDVKPYPFDPEKAKSLLKEAGYADGFSFSWTVTQGIFTKDIEIAQAVANQLGKVGIKANLKTTERARVLTERDQGDFDVTELRWPMYWSPAVIYTFTINAAYPDDKLAPKFGAAPPELVELRKLLQEASSANNLEQAGKVYVQINHLMHDEALWMFVHTIDQLWGVQKDTGWRPYPMGDPFWYDYWPMIGKTAPTDPTVPLVLK